MNQSEPSIVVHVRCVSTDQPPTTNHQPPVARRAFTLLELLVVIGIILLFASLGLTAIFRLGTVNRLAAAEQTIAGAIRQAKHTARSTGNPVLIEFDDGTASGTGESSIRGTVASVLWSERFEGNLDPDPSNPEKPDTFPLAQVPLAGHPDPWSTLRNNRGRTGRGFHLQVPPADHSQIGRVQTCTLERDRAIIDRGSRRDGVLIRLAFRLHEPGISPPGGWIPLVLVDADDSATADVPRPVSTAALGIAIRGTTRSLYHTLLSGDAPDAPHDDASPTPANLNPHFPAWEIAAWCYGTIGAVVHHEVISTWNHNPPGLVQTYTTRTEWQDFNERVATLSGDQWHELQFMATVDRMTLILDGVVVADRPVARPELPVAPYVYLGMADIDGVLPHLPNPVPGPTVMAATVTLDDLRILRLAGGSAGKLPGGLAFANGSTRVLCLPDGRNIMGSGGMNADATLAITGRFDEKNDGAAITLHSDGTVSSVLTPASR